MLAAAEDLAERVGTAAACEALGVSRATLYRRRSPAPPPPPEESKPRRSRRALSEEERQGVREVLHSVRLVDASPVSPATLADEDR